MFNRYFQQEISNLRDLAAEFAKAHPALAPMLEGQSADPDVERLLEGVAFLTGLLREKIDDEFPEIIQGLMQLIFPHYLRPIPATTIIAFNPKPNLKQPYTVPAGVKLASNPIDGTQCIFQTCYEVEAHPLKLKAAFFDQMPGQPPLITLAFKLTGMDLSRWTPTRLRLHLAKEYPDAANIFYLLIRCLRSITLASVEGGSSCVLEPDQLRPVGFTEEEGMLPYPSHSFPGYRIIQEYFILPHKYLFIDINGFDRWTNRGNGAEFKIIFEFKELPFPPPKITGDNFVLFATPAVNVFEHDADPISLDHRRNEYRVRPSGQNKAHYQVYSVDKVSGYRQGTVKAREYEPFEMFQTESRDHPIYHVSFKRSPVGNTIDALLSFTYPDKGETPAPETLSIAITCTNGELAERLQVGDISQPTSNSPELLEFKNIRPPTASVLPPLGSTLLWRFLSLYSLNYLSLARADNIKALLKLYIFSESRDQTATYTNNRRVEGISAVDVRREDRLVMGYLMRGQEIVLKAHSDHFASDGDLFIFGSVLENFFGCYASINSFTNFRIEEVLKGDIYKWPARIGDRPLI